VFCCAGKQGFVAQQIKSDRKGMFSAYGCKKNPFQQKLKTMQIVRILLPPPRKATRLNRTLPM